MALTVTPNLTNWTLAESGESGTWEVLQVNAGSGLNTDEYLQGASCYSATTKTADTRSYVIYNYGSNQNLSNTVIRIWARHGEIPKFYDRHDTVNGKGGISIYVEDGSGNWGEWWVGGADMTKEGWNYYVVDVNTPFDVNSGTVGFSTLRKIGMSNFVNTKPSRSDNVFIDAIRYGKGLTITGTVTEAGNGWAELAAIDESTSNKYGVFQSLPGGGYLLTGDLTFGDSAGTGSVDFSDYSGAVIFTRNNELIGGELTTAGIHKISVVGNSTGTTDFQLGIVNGTGDDRAGSLGTTFVCELDRITFDSETDTADIDSCELYGCTFENCGTVKIAGSTTQEIISSTFLDCDEVQPNTAEFLNNTIITPKPDRGVELSSASHQMKNLTFITGGIDTNLPIDRGIRFSNNGTRYYDDTWRNNNTTNFTEPWGGSVGDPGDAQWIGSRSIFSGLYVDLYTGNTGGATFAYEYYNGSTWSAFTGVTDGTSVLTVDGVITWTLPTNWATGPSGIYLEDNGEYYPDYYFMRIRMTAIGSGGIARPYQFQLRNLIEHHLHVPTATTYSVSKYDFIGFGAAGTPKWHGENSTTGTVTINASSSTLLQNEMHNTNSGTTVVNSVTDVTLSGLVANTEVRVYEAGTTTEIDGVENSGTSFTFTADTGDSVDIVIHHVQYEHLRIESYTIPFDNTTIPVQQRFDRNYNNP